ncbi:MAG: hypothetical protein H0U57_13230 [Tatlockia sp.]|nr:hypothetical protein [Tatlockia sp.]
MNKPEMAKNFAIYFKQAAGNTAAVTFSSCIRFVAIMMVIIAVIWSINHFMGNAQREQDSFLLLLGSRLVRLVIGLCLFILILIVKGN